MQSGFPFDVPTRSDRNRPPIRYSGICGPNLSRVAVLRRSKQNGQVGLPILLRTTCRKRPRSERQIVEVSAQLICA